MKSNVMRVYDRNEQNTNTGLCYFLILPEEYDPENEWHFQEYVVPNLARVSGMSWQSYTSYLLGMADIDESEMFWSEITGYTLKECKIDISRVEVAGKYVIPEQLIS